ncbi:MAG: periplasmic heavy metal sensor [Parvularculaceae bacterium]
MGRGVTIALLVSLALNIFAVGFIGGRFVGDRTAPPPPHERMRSAGPAAFWSGGEGLPPEDRDAFIAVFREHHEELRTLNEDIHRARLAFSAALGAPQWDRAAVERAHSELKAAEARRDSLMSVLFLDAMETLPAEQRRILAERSERSHHRKRKLRRRHHRQDS